MIKIAIMGSGNGGNFEAIAKYFKDKKDVQITCLSNIKDAYILERAKKLDVKNQFLPFEDNFKYFSKNKFDLVVLAGYMKILSDNVLSVMDKVVNIHPSLLPSFKGSKDAIKDAFLAGVKVSGVTIHQVTSDIDGGKIIAQYPVFIREDMHFDEFKQEIHKLEHKLYPVVIDKLINNKVFEFSDLIKNACKGSCKSGCGNCK